MTTINVNRSLTISSIINSFLKVIVMMHLLTTPGSFVGDPIGHDRRGRLVSTKTNHRFKNKMMILATQVALPGSFKEVPVPSLVLSLPTTDTTINTQKKKITGSSLVVKKINLAVEAYLVEELACWTNVTAAPSHYDAVVRTLDTFPLVRPFLSISHKNISDSSLWLSDHEELFLHSSLPFAARILDRVVAEMYLGVERFLEWHFDSFVTLFWNATEEWWDRSVAASYDLLNQVGFAVKRQLAVSVLSSIREKLDKLLDEFSWYPFNHFHNDLDPAWPCLSCTNVTAAPNHYDAVVRTLDTFPLVRPFLPISYKNISDSSLWRSDEQLILRPSLPFAARILDRVAAEMYLGVERFVEWNFDSFVTLLWNAAEEWWDRSVAASYNLLNHVEFTTVNPFSSTIWSSIREKFFDKDNATWYPYNLFQHRIVKELGPFLLFVIVFVASFDFFYLRFLWLLRKIFKCLRKSSGHIHYRCHRPFEESPSCLHRPQRQIVGFSRRCSYKIHREILPFELHLMCTRWSKNHVRHTLWLQKECPKDEFLCARKFFRDDEFFERAKGSCAKMYGLCIEPIIEEDEGALDMEEVVDAGIGAEGGEFLNDDIWCDALDEEDMEENTCVMTNISTPALLECDSGSTAPDGTESVPQLVYDTNHASNNKTREGEVVVGCFARSSVLVHDKEMKVKQPIENGPALGSGFYVDIMGRKRRFSHRLLAKMTVVVAK